jgi:outer membrane protein insertion porin family
LDTSDQRIKGQIRILPFRDSIFHPRFRVGKINVYPDYRAGQESFISYQRQEGYANFLSEDGEFSINPKLLEDNIFFQPGTLYQQSDLSRTNRKLGEMDIYRFISVDPIPDTLDPSVLNFDIRLIPKDRWVIGYNAELNTFANSQSNALIGGSFSLNLRNRNLLKGAELFTINSGMGIEFSRRLDQQIISTLDGRLEMNLRIPKFSDPIRFYGLLNRLKLLNDNSLASFRQDAQTSLSLGYNYVSLIDFYQYSQVNTSFGYEFRPSNRVNLTINHLSLDYLAATAKDSFQVILSRNPFLRNSFESEQFFTSIFLRDITHTWRKDHLATGDSWLIRNGLELSGWEVHAGNALINLFRKNKPERLAFSGVPFSFFARYEFDGRYYKTYTPAHSLAFRLNTAIAVPYGQTTEVPYVKQYFLGGPTSLRAWRIREIGPGGYADPIIFDPDNTQVFYQTGDFKLEFNAEYRFNLFKFYAQVEGAFFVDIGNVWTLKEDSTRVGSQLRWTRETDENGKIIQDNFLNQLAIGTGFGIRADFSYFLIRLDLGYPVRNFFPRADGPFQNSYWVHHSFADLSLSRLNYNLAIGYPF